MVDVAIGIYSTLTLDGGHRFVRSHGAELTSFCGHPPAPSRLLSI